MSANSFVNPTSNVQAKEFDGAAWATEHQTDFKELIQRARQTKNRAEQKTADVPEIPSGELVTDADNPSDGGKEMLGRSLEPVSPNLDSV